MRIEPFLVANNIDILHSKSDSLGLFFFPENFEEVVDSANFIYPESTSDIRKTFRANQTEISFLSEEKPLLRVRKSADWFGPTLFISFSALSQNSELISISLNLISNYLDNFFKGSTSNKKIKMDIIVENKKKEEYSKIEYEGGVEGLKEVEKIIKQLKK